MAFGGLTTIKLLKEPPKKERVLCAEEIQKLLAVSKKNYNLHNAILLAFNHPLRKGIEILMPKINEDCTTIRFKIKTSYFQAILEGRKTADIRQVSEKWKHLLEYCEFIEFQEERTAKCIRATKIEVHDCPLTARQLVCLFGDISWNQGYAAAMIYFKNPQLIEGNNA